LAPFLYLEIKLLSVTNIATATK